ncbi:unnamed protein product [Rotaria magnacalcarata]|uniref:B box-type domain-containing protein n=3 Tax=Rotaria magnacalcarata TaxID=392030 RepID=A0A816VGP2_9BILA|nr:unnamed protein product [Rotaria magnacalcarata]
MTNNYEEASSSSEIICLNCQSEEATLWCKKCDTSYCSVCFELAHSQPIWKTHAAIPIDDKPVVLVSCYEHPDEKLKFWCNECSTLVCRDCVIVNHQGHTCTIINDIAQEKANELEDSFSKAQLSLNRAMKELTDRRATDENDSIETITRTFDTIRMLIADCENELKTKINAIEKQNNDLIENLQLQLESKQEELNKQSRYFERLFSTNSYMKLLQGNPKMMNYLKATTQELNKLKMPIKTEYRIKGIDCLQESVVKVLQQLCIDDWKQAPLRSSAIVVHSNAKWIQNGLTVAGGNGQGNQINQLSNPRGLFVDDDQNIYIADQENHRIMEWKRNATSGRVVAGGNGPGRGARQLNNPYDVIIDKMTDSLIISDYSNKRVVRWPRRNGASGETIISNICCIGLTIDDRGSLYVVDYGRHAVRRYRMDGTEEIVVAGGNGQGDSLDQLSDPWYVYVDRDRSVYVSDYSNHRVMKWEEDAKQGIIVAGVQSQGNGLTQLSYPYGVVVDQSGTVYVVDQGNNRIMAWKKGATEGRIIIGGNGKGGAANQFSCPWSLSFDRHVRLSTVFERLTSFDDRQCCFDYIEYSIGISTPIFLILFDQNDAEIPVTTRKIRTIYRIHSETLSPPLPSQQHFYNVEQVKISLRRDIRALIDDIPFSIIQNSVRQLDPMRAPYTSLMGFMDVFISLTRNDDRKISQRDFLVRCRAAYIDSSVQLRTIDRFAQEYQSFEQAIGWYTRDSFVYRRANQALCSQNPDIIHKYRFLINDLMHHLDNLFETQKQNPPNEHNLTVYRRQATLDRDMAIEFVLVSTNGSDILSVLVVLNLDRTLLYIRPFASIEHLSVIPQEREVSISIGSIFRLHSVEFVESIQVWIIKMTLIEFDRDDIKSLRIYSAAHQVSLDIYRKEKSSIDDEDAAAPFFCAAIHYTIMVNEYAKLENNRTELIQQETDRLKENMEDIFKIYGKRKE